MNPYLTWTVKKYVQNDLKRMGFPSKFISEYIADLYNRRYGRPFRYITEVFASVINQQLKHYGLYCEVTDCLTIKPLKNEIC